MYNIKLSSYVPEPKPVTTDRIVAAHYYPAWKRGAARLHNGFDDLAERFPENTPLMGYYDEENPEVCDWEIKWAVEHGINCFVYCWYRNHENTGKPITVDDLRCGHGIHEALFHARYRNFIRFAIMFENAPRWGSTTREDLLENLMPFWTEQYFRKDNYLKIDGKPVLFFCAQWRFELDHIFADAEDQRETFERCREYAKAQGFPGLIIADVDWDGRPIKSVFDDRMARGYDFRFGYNSCYKPTCDFPEQEDVIKGQVLSYQKRLALDPMRHIPTASCFSDPTPRTTEHWNDLGFRFSEQKVWYLEPENFRSVLERMKAMSDALPDGAWAKKIMMIDNWNEWDEGHYVSPSHGFGFRYLQAVREALTECDNLPDYRMPQDMGFTGYNTSWVTPDFSAFCEKRLAEKK